MVKFVKRKDMERYLKGKTKNNIVKEVQQGKAAKPSWVMDKLDALFLIATGIVGIVSSLNDFPTGFVTGGIYFFVGAGMLILGILSLVLGLWRLVF